MGNAVGPSPANVISGGLACYACVDGSLGCNEKQNIGEHGSHAVSGRGLRRGWLLLHCGIEAFAKRSFWTFLLLGSIWSSDAGAYFVGKLIGKNKLWPSISPNKTVEGALGGIAIAIVTSLVFAWASDGLLTWERAIFIGLAAAVVGQMGDLIQSAYKRIYNIKDSGNLLPGHGGILDRCDSWIVVFPFVHILMLLPY